MELIELDLIDPNPYQPRQSYDQEGIEKLARGIKLKRETLPDTCGLMQVPMARQVDGRYQLAFGHRRGEAFKHNFRVEVAASEWAKMPLQIVELTDEEMYDFAARENGDREDINPIEKARSILEAQEKFGWNLQRAASVHGLSKSAASNLTRLLQLPEEVRQLLVDQAISQRQARELVRLIQCDEEFMTPTCIGLARECQDGEMTVSDLKGEIDGIIREHTNRQKIADHIKDQLCPHCDTPVSLHDSGIISFGCENGHHWTSLVEFNIDWRQREYREQEELKAEERRQEIHTLYCPKCNHPQEFNGHDVHEGEYKKCENCNAGSLLFVWLKDARTVMYRPLNLDSPDDDPDGAGGDIETTAAPACPWWTNIPGTAETCYICGHPAEWHNNGDLNQAGADLHLCSEHYFGNLSNVNAHSTEEQLRGILDRIKAMEEADREEEAKEAEAVEYAVYPCHVCGEKKINIDPVANCVRCDGCGNFWDLISEYHEDRERVEKEIEADSGVPESEKRQMCEHCCKREANVQNVPYCSICWHEELIDWLKCPICNATSTIAKSRPTDDQVKCWSCKNESEKREWLDHTANEEAERAAIVAEREARVERLLERLQTVFSENTRPAPPDPGDEIEIAVSQEMLASAWVTYSAVELQKDRAKAIISVRGYDGVCAKGVIRGDDILEMTLIEAVSPDRWPYQTCDYKAGNYTGQKIKVQGQEYVLTGREINLVPIGAGEKCSDCGKPGQFSSYHELSDDKPICFDCYLKRSKAIGDMSDKEYKSYLAEQYGITPTNGDGRPDPDEVISPEVERQSLMIDVNNRWLALIRRADINQIRELDAALDDIEQSVFPENTPEQEMETEPDEELPEYVPEYLEEINQWKR